MVWIETHQDNKKNAVPINFWSTLESKQWKFSAHSGRCRGSVDVEEQVRGDGEVNIQNECSLMKEVLEWP